MNILAIESSCDETAAAVVRDGRTVLSNCISICDAMQLDSTVQLHRVTNRDAHHLRRRGA